MPSWHLKQLLVLFGIFGALTVGGCAQTSLLTQSAPTQQSGETGSLAVKPSGMDTGDTTFIVPGDPAGVYTLVARGALNCWFGAQGPLKPTHIFQAEAAPDSKGGAAEIVLQERDTSLPDQRGVRAYRVSLASTGGNTQLTVAASKLDPKYALAMQRDVEIWARGGEGCQLRTVAPPPPSPPPPATPVKGKTKR